MLNTGSSRICKLHANGFCRHSATTATIPLSVSGKQVNPGHLRGRGEFIPYVLDALNSRDSRQMRPQETYQRADRLLDLEGPQSVDIIQRFVFCLLSYLKACYTSSTCSKRQSHIPQTPTMLPSTIKYLCLRSELAFMQSTRAYSTRSRPCGGDSNDVADSDAARQWYSKFDTSTIPSKIATTNFSRGSGNGGQKRQK